MGELVVSAVVSGLRTQERGEAVLAISIWQGLLRYRCRVGHGRLAKVPLALPLVDAPVGARPGGLLAHGV